jgi:hypothetical protein
MAGVRAWRLTAEAEAAADEINRFVNCVGVPKFEEKMDAEEEEEFRASAPALALASA